MNIWKLGLVTILVTGCATVVRCQPQNGPANARTPDWEIHLKVKFVKLATVFDATEGPGAVLHGFPDLILATNHATGFVERDAVTAVLNDQQYRAVLKTLEEKDGTEVLTLPEVTTERGHQAQIRGPKNLTLAVPSRTGTPAGGASATTNMSTGPMLDVIPEIGTDGYSVHMAMVPRVIDFVGYVNPGRFVPQASVPTGATITSVLPLPPFVSRDWAASATIWDGQTVVTSLVLESWGPPVTPDPEKEHEKLMLVFVTPTIVNPDGTRLHSSDEMNAPRFSSLPPPFSTSASSVPEKVSQ